MDNLAPVIIGGIVVFGSATFFLEFYLGRKHTEAMRQVAEDLGLLFAKDASHVTADIQSRFELFSYGRFLRAKNAIHGESNGTGVWIFDYAYTTSDGDSLKIHEQTIVCLASSELSLPRFHLCRRSRKNRHADSTFGMQEVSFDSDPEFPKCYVLKGDAAQDVRDTFTESLRSFLEQQDRHLRVEGYRDQMLVYRAGEKVGPEKVQDFLAEAFGIFREFQSS